MSLTTGHGGDRREVESGEAAQPEKREGQELGHGPVVESMKVVLCGPPHSGKSCLREGLKAAIAATEDAPYPYVITGAPDGEGAWFQEAAAQDADLAAAIKKDYKGGFTPEFVGRIAESVEQCDLPLCIVDIGGRTSDENRQITAGATHAILLAGDMDKLPEWREFAAEQGLTVIAEIHSDYPASEDAVQGVGADGILRGSVHHLERGEDLADRPMIQALAQLVVSMAPSQKKAEAEPAPATEGDPLDGLAMQASRGTYLVEQDATADIPTLKISFNPDIQTTNDQLVRDAVAGVRALELEGGELICLNGAASLAVAVGLSEELAHKFGAVAVFDPKMSNYVVSVSHSPDYSPGDTIEKDGTVTRSSLEAGDAYQAQTIEDPAGTGTVLKIGFNKERQAQNDQLVVDAVAAVQSLGLEGGDLVKLNGPASLPVGVAIAHEIKDLYGATAVFDPKLPGDEKYVVSKSTTPSHSVGDLIA